MPGQFRLQFRERQFADADPGARLHPPHREGLYRRDGGDAGRHRPDAGRRDQQPDGAHRPAPSVAPRGLDPHGADVASEWGGEA